MPSAGGHWLESSPGHLGTGTVRGVIPSVLRIAAEGAADNTAGAAADAAGLADACGDRPSWFCEATWNATHNQLISKAVDWFVSRPLAAIVVAVVAALIARWLRRAATAVLTRITQPPGIAGSALERMGVVSAPDPRDATRTRTLCAVARTTISTLVWTVATLIILGIFHVDIGPLLAGAGIAGIAIGLGAQSLVRDCIAGFFMLLEDQCGVGDDIDISTVSGRVEGLTLRATTIRSADGTLWTVPNGAIVRVGNQSRSWAQANVDVFLGNDRDLVHAADVARQAMAVVSAEPDIEAVLLREPQVLGVESVDSNGAVLRLTVRTKPGEQGHVARRMRLAVTLALGADPSDPSEPGA